jgi:hypothetical protein
MLTQLYRLFIIQKQGAFTRLCFEGSPLRVFGQSCQALPDPVAGAAHQFRAADPAQPFSPTKACAIASVAIFSSYLPV